MVSWSSVADTLPFTESEGPVGPNTVETVGCVTATDTENDHGTDAAGVPSPGVADAFVVAAGIVAFGSSFVVTLVITLVVVVIRQTLHSKSNERRG